MQRFWWLKAAAVAASVLALSACGGHGGGGNNNNPPPSTTTTYTVGGTVTGLTSGSVTLRLNGGNDLTVNAAGSFTFAAQLTNGTSYTAVVTAQPSSLICGPAVGNGTGTISGANVTNLTLSCAPYHVGGNVTGLKGAGLVLEVNYAGDLAIPVPPSGAASFTFPGLPTTLPLYTIRIKSQPAGQTCTIVNSSGAISSTAPDATAAAVACIDNVTDPLSGTYVATMADGAPITGFRAYMTFNADGTYVFGLHQDDAQCGPSGHGGVEYGVYRFTQATHAFEIRNAVIDTNGSCGVGLASSTLVASSDGTLTFADASGSFAMAPVKSTSGQLSGSWGDNLGFMVFSGGKAFVALTRAITQNGATSPGVEDGCYVLAGTEGAGTFTLDFGDTCAVSATQKGADTSGPVGASPALAGRAVDFTVSTDTLNWTVNGAYAFPFMANARIKSTALPVSKFTVGGTISALTGTGLGLRLNGQTGADFNVSPPAGATSFGFAAQLEPGSNYFVSTVAHPGTPTQFCTPVSNGAGTIAASNVTVGVNCFDSASYTLGGTVSGATSSGLTLRVTYLDSTGALVSADLAVAAGATSYLFPPNTIAANSVYFLGILTQPSGATCTLTKGTAFSFGPTTVTNISNIVCTTNAASALRGTYSTMNDDGTGRTYLNFNADGTVVAALASNDPDCGSRNGNGVEYGVFSWNQATGALTLQNPPVIDTNDGCGLWEPGTAPNNPALNVTRVNDTIEVRQTAGGPLLGTGKAVTSNAGTIVGGWSREAANGNFIVFHEDGTFLIVDVQASNLYPAGYGQERGCYTVSGSTLTLTIEGTCRPDGLAPQDYNGEGGVFRTGVKTLGGVPFVLNDANTLSIFGGVFKRTAPS